MNACASCRHGKRKCNKARPSCSNCVRLKRVCIYTEDFVQSHFTAPLTSSQPQSRRRSPPSVDPLPQRGLVNQENPRQSMKAVAMETIGSLETLHAISADFFTGTHQRISAISKIRFYQNFPSLSTSPAADFATLCLSILLIQKLPSGKATQVQSPLYTSVKNFITILEGSNEISLNLLHSRVLVTFYEMGHGLHTAAYVSLAATARLARALGLHRKPWRFLNAESDKLLLEEQKRTWWAIGNMDRFINLCSGDALFVTNDSEQWDPLPIEDLLWAEGSDLADLNRSITAPPTLDTPFNTRVGQLARECQISHLAGRVIRHVFEPLRDRNFNVEEGFQLERTLTAYLPLLANEELEIGKYCGAFGVCNRFVAFHNTPKANRQRMSDQLSALFILYEFMLSRCHGDFFERNRVLQAIKETSLRALKFAEATHADRFENYPIETQSPYLIYSLYQAAVVQYRLWVQDGDPVSQRNLGALKDILNAFTKRWIITYQYLEILDKLDEDWPPIALPFQGLFISSGGPRISS